MDDFTERMLERTQRRQKLLASTLSQVSQPTPSSAMETSPTIQQSDSPPARRQRRTRLAELANQVDQWLSDDQNFKQSENISNPKKTEKINDIQNEPNKLVTVSSQYAIKKDIIKTNENKSTDIQQPKPQQYSNKLKQLRHQQQLDKEPQPQKHSPNLSSTTLTVAQRRALFEPNIVTQQQSKKPITTTTVTISLTKTTPATVNTTTSTTAANEATEESAEEVIKTPPRPIPRSESTPPSRRGSRPRTSLGASAASNNLIEHQRSVWTPPCIKNVLLKKKLINELEDDEQSSDNSTKDKIGLKRGPFDKYNSGSIKYKPASPSSNLYPDLSLIADDNLGNDTSLTPLEIQPMACKRRSNGSSALNTSTTSSESVPEDCDDAENLGAKRYRCHQKEKSPETNNIASLQEVTSPSTPITGFNSTPGGGHCSLLSSHAGSPLSQACSSFIFQHGNESLSGNKSFSNSTEQRQGLDQQCNAQANQLPESRLIDKYFEFVNSDGEEELAEPITDNVFSPKELGSCGRLQFNNSKHNVDNIEPDKLNSSSSSSSSSNTKPALVHTISTYRKQQQQLRLNGANSSNKQQIRIPERVTEEQDEDTDEEEIHLQELEKVAARARDLERIVVPEQDRIIEQATQALNICDVYRQKNTLRPVISNQFSPEHIHAERLLLIAGLRRTDAVREAQRLRVERTLLPGGIMGERSTYLSARGNGKTLVIQSLRVPILSSLNSGGNHNKMKHNSGEGLENLTRWPGGYRYFVCAIRAVATVHRPPVTAASRPADAVEESVLRFSNDAAICRNIDEINYGYVEFITKKRVKNSGSRKCPAPTESEGAPILIHGLDDRGWKITVELYGISPTSSGEHDHHNGGNVKEHDGHENKSVLDKLWSTVTTPSKDPKKTSWFNSNSIY
uniref:Actin-binding protein anillin n=1 Tax=Melanaphis sacchari TaxID=742174 RepID=A0A2H8TRJ4_9HEMI